MDLFIRRVVDGRVFDTETAELVAIIKNNDGDHFAHERTGLYRSPKGQFFLAGHGGASSRWRRLAADKDGYVPGEGIKLVTESEALAVATEAGDSIDESFFEIAEG